MFKPSPRYVARILLVLNSIDRINLSNLSMKSRVNHQRCRDHIIWLVSEELVSPSFHSSRKYFEITPRGRDYIERVLELSRMTASNSANNLYVQNVN